jgi:hypothetical protein
MITVRRYWDYPRGVIIVFFRDILLFLTKHPLKGRFLAKKSMRVVESSLSKSSTSAGARMSSSG